MKNGIREVNRFSSLFKGQEVIWGLKAHLRRKSGLNGHQTPANGITVRERKAISGRKIRDRQREIDERCLRVLAGYEWESHLGSDVEALRGAMWGIFGAKREIRVGSVESVRKMRENVKVC